MMNLTEASTCPKCGEGDFFCVIRPNCINPSCQYYQGSKVKPKEVSLTGEELCGFGFDSTWDDRDSKYLRFNFDPGDNDYWLEFLLRDSGEGMSQCRIIKDRESSKSIQDLETSLRYTSLRDFLDGNDAFCHYLKFSVWEISHELPAIVGILKKSDARFYDIDKKFKKWNPSFEIDHEEI